MTERAQERGRDASSPHPGVTRSSHDVSGATVMQYRFEPGACFPLHRHRQTQVTIVTEGSVIMETTGGSHELSVGEFNVMGPEIVHGVRAGPSGAALTAILVPARTESDWLSLDGD